MRSAAQMIAYEVPILIAVVAVVVVSGSFDLTTIVQEQQNYWFWGPLFLALIVFVAGMLAEMERIPFDLPEAEAELVEGWNTEYRRDAVRLLHARRLLPGPHREHPRRPPVPRGVDPADLRARRR